MDLIISVAIGVTFIILLISLALCYTIARHRKKTLVDPVNEKRPSIDIDEFEMSKKASESKQDSMTQGNKDRRIS